MITTFILAVKLNIIQGVERSTPNIEGNTSFNKTFAVLITNNHNQNSLCTGEPAIRSRYARLTVLVPPQPPKILQGNYLSTIEDRHVKLECVSIGGKPPAEVSISDIHIHV